MKYIPLSVPNFEGNEREYVADAIASTFVSAVGGYVSRLEKELASYLGVSDTAVCQSGTAAIHLAMIEAGVRPGDVVLVPPVTFIAAVNPVKYQYALPVFIDCDDSLCMDPAKLKDFCETECSFTDGVLSFKGHHVKAVVVVHVFGNMADMEAIMSVADIYGLKVIEDATESLGTKYTAGKYSGKFSGTIGDFGCFSFNGNKIITTGGGGAVTANPSERVSHIRYLSTQAKNDPHYYVHDEVGYNYRMTNLQAALGVAQLEELDEFIRRKNANYELYAEAFSGFEFGELMPFREGVRSNKWFYSLKINRERIHASMREIITSLDAQGIQTRAIWGLINEQLPYRNEYAFRIEKAPYYASRILNLPCTTSITKEEIAHVSDRVKELLRSLAE